MHGKPSEVSPTALDAVLAVELEAVALEEGSCGKAGKSGNLWGANGAQRGLDATVKAAGQTMTSERRMSEERVEVAVECVGTEACEEAVRMGQRWCEGEPSILASVRHQVGLVSTRQSAPGYSRAPPTSESKPYKSQ